MLSIKAICKSENNEEVVIIGFELEGYCLCMTKSGTIFHAKHEDLTIVDKAYMEACAKESIDFEIADFLEKASARLDQIQSKHLTSIILELQKYRSKIEQGTLIESPCKVGDIFYGISDHEVFKYNVLAIKLVRNNKIVLCTVYDIEFILGKDAFLTREEAENKLKELQNG